MKLPSLIILGLLLALSSCTTDGKIDKAKATAAVNAAGTAALNAYLGGATGKAIKSAAVAAGAAVIAPTPDATTVVEAPATVTK